MRHSARRIYPQLDRELRSVERSVDILVGVVVVVFFALAVLTAYVLGWRR
jgi:hypothetical protein